MEEQGEDAGAIKTKMKEHILRRRWWGKTKMEEQDEDEGA